jgi:hypothetical protein
VTRAQSFAAVPVGARVTVRRADGSTFQTTTASRAFEMWGGAAVIRVVSLDAQDYYLLDRVSLGWAEQRPPHLTVVPLAAALDPVPDEWTLTDAAVSLGLAMALIYAVGSGLVAILDAVAR